MASVQAVGGTPGINESGLVDLLKTGMVIRRQDRKDREDRKQGNDDIIKAGINSKTMRPAKDGEKSDFSDSSGRGWVYDDTGIKELHTQAENQRKDAHWITINSNVERELQQAINSQQIDGTNQQAVTAFRNQRIASYLGVGIDGKMSSDAKDDLSPEGQAWVDSLTKNAGPVGSSKPPADANLPHPFLAGNPGALEALAGVWSKMNAPSNSPNNGPHGNLVRANPGNLPANPGNLPANPDMQALMSLLAMNGQQPPMARNVVNNPYLDGSGVPLGPVSLQGQ